MSSELKAKRAAHLPGLHLTKDEFYDLCKFHTNSCLISTTEKPTVILGGAELATRFLEFEPKCQRNDPDDVHTGQLGTK